MCVPNRLGFGAEHWGVDSDDRGWWAELAGRAADKTTLSRHLNDLKRVSSRRARSGACGRRLRLCSVISPMPCNETLPAVNDRRSSSRRRRRHAPTNRTERGMTYPVLHLDMKLKMPCFHRGRSTTCARHSSKALAKSKTRRVMCKNGICQFHRVSRWRLV